jgi:DNA-binding CsgD family transcriptional regulator
MQATGEHAEHWFDEALVLHDELGAPFERARTLLRRGESRRNRGCTARARDDFAAARLSFDQLGATQWSATVPAHRHNTPLGTTPKRPYDRLTPAEQRVARAACHGRKNRDIAADLYLSPKTVDHHLQAIYRKLGVHSRTELTVMLTGDATST